MHTPEFEKWWESFAHDVFLLCGHDQVEDMKYIVWLAWRTGREKLHEELQHTLLQHN
jgi:hypothetical protein